jgi:hypothetical protein
MFCFLVSCLQKSHGFGLEHLQASFYVLKMFTDVEKYLRPGGAALNVRRFLESSQ